MQDQKFQDRLNRLPPKQNQTMGCLIYVGTLHKKGYGTITRTWPKTIPSYLRKTTTFLAHRYAWFLGYGKWPDDQLLHHCDNPPCCELTHLFEGSNQDNVNDRVSKGRSASVVGENNPNCSYANEVIEAVRTATGPTTQIAKRFGMSQSHVWNIRNGKARPKHAA